MKRLSAWEGFVLRHHKPGNLAFHFVSLLMFWCGPALALWTADWRWLLLFFASGAVGTVGHRLFDDGEVNLHEATSSPRVVFYVGVMFYKLARGTYYADVDRAKQKYAALTAGAGG